MAQNVLGTLDISYQGEAIHLGGEWPRMTMKEAVKRYAGVDFDAWQSDEDARQAVKQAGFEPEKNATKGECLNQLFEETVEQNLVQPTFIYDYPIEVSPLAKRKADDPMFTERFEFFMIRFEMGNAFSELNDPIDQRERFEKQVALRKAQGIHAEAVSYTHLDVYKRQSRNGAPLRRSGATERFCRAACRANTCARRRTEAP